jgi:hypothetical protein
VRTALRLTGMRRSPMSRIALNCGAFGGFAIAIKQPFKERSRPVPGNSSAPCTTTSRKRARKRGELRRSAPFGREKKAARRLNTVRAEGPDRVERRCVNHKERCGKRVQREPVPPGVFVGLAVHRLTGDSFDSEKVRGVALANDRKIVGLHGQLDGAASDETGFLVQLAQRRRGPIRILGLRFAAGKLPAAVAVTADTATEKQTAVVDDDGRNPDCRKQLAQLVTFSFGCCVKTRSKSGAIGEKLDM